MSFRQCVKAVIGIALLPGILRRMRRGQIVVSRPADLRGEHEVEYIAGIHLSLQRGPDESDDVQGIVQDFLDSSVLQESCQITQNISSRLLAVDNVNGIIGKGY